MPIIGVSYELLDRYPTLPTLEEWDKATKILSPRKSVEFQALRSAIQNDRRDSAVKKAFKDWLVAKLKANIQPFKSDRNKPEYRAIERLYKYFKMSPPKTPVGRCLEAEKVLAIGDERRRELEAEGKRLTDKDQMALLLPIDLLNAYIECYRASSLGIATAVDMIYFKNPQNYATLCKITGWASQWVEKNPSLFALLGVKDKASEMTDDKLIQNISQLPKTVAGGDGQDRELMKIYIKWAAIVAADFHMELQGKHDSIFSLTPDRGASLTVSSFSHVISLLTVGLPFLH